MYEAFYGMRNRPFSPIPHPECFVPIPQMGDALRELRTCVERDQGMAVLTAPAGAGKTLLCRRLCRELADRYACAFLGTSRFSSRRALLQGVLYELGQPYLGLSEQESRLGIFDALRTETAGSTPLLLVMDEAHLLPPRFLEELRILADYDVAGRPLIHVLLSGQLALEETLSEGPLTALNQRVGCHVCLESLTADESAEYVRQRLAWAGTELPDAIFSPAALSLIVHAAEGNPRRINQLADHSLLIGYADEEFPISLGTVQNALIDVRELPLQWNEPLALSWHEAAADGPADFSADDLASSSGGASSAAEFDLSPGAGSSAVFEWGSDPAPAPAASPSLPSDPASSATPRFSFETDDRTAPAAGEAELWPPVSGAEERATDGTLDWGGDEIGSTDFEEALLHMNTDGQDSTEPLARLDESDRGLAGAPLRSLAVPGLEPGASADPMDGSIELMSKIGFEEVVVDDRYALLDRRNESGNVTFEYPSVFRAVGTAPAFDAAETIGTGERSIEEDLRDLLITMQSEVMAAIAPTATAPLYDVVEPEDDFPTAAEHPTTLQFQPASALELDAPPSAWEPEPEQLEPVFEPSAEFSAESIESVADESVSEESLLEEVAAEEAPSEPDRPVRRFAQLFSRLQRQRGRMESLFRREGK